MARILFADDEARLRETTRDYLTAKGFDVTLAADGYEAAERAAEAPFDLIILDVLMPGLDGFEALKEIRRFSDAPALFLSALGTEREMLKGFSLGADDYIVKPYSLAVLCEKCRAMLEGRARRAAAEVLRAGEIEVRPEERRAFVGGREIGLTAKCFGVLLLLMRNAGRTLSRERILDRVWGADYDGGLRTVDAHVKLLRKALGSEKDRLETVVGAGYRIAETENRR